MKEAGKCGGTRGRWVPSQDPRPLPALEGSPGLSGAGDRLWSPRKPKWAALGDMGPSHTDAQTGQVTAQGFLQAGLFQPRPDVPSHYFSAQWGVGRGRDALETRCGGGQFGHSFYLLKWLSTDTEKVPKSRGLHCLLPFAFLVTTVKLSFKRSPKRRESLTVMNGEQMFQGRQSGSVPLHVWAVGPGSGPLSHLGGRTDQAPRPALGSKGT